MTNPYQPPRQRIRFAPFHRRFVRGVRLAVSAYVRGTRREKISPLQHVMSWCALLLILLIASVWLGSIAYGAYNYLLIRWF